MTIAVPSRDQKRVVIDRFLALCAADAITRSGGHPGKVLFHKVIFAIRLRLGERAAPEYQFRRWKHGPWSPVLANDLDQLADYDLVRPDVLVTTERGAQLVHAFRPDLQQANRETFAAIDAEAAKRATWSGSRAKEEAYAYKVRIVENELGAATSRTVPLKDIAEGTDLEISGDPAPEFKADDDLLRELAFSLALTPERVRRAHSFTPESTSSVRRMLSP